MTDLASLPDYTATLTAAAIAFRHGGGDRAPSTQENRPTSTALVNALVQAEKIAKQQRLRYPFESLQGRWRLCFTANRKAHERSGTVLGKGWYVPKLAPAHISFSQNQSLERSDRGEISNQLQLGSFLLRFTGPCRYLGKKNLLCFDFTQIQIRLLGRTLYQGNFRGGNAQTQEFYPQSVGKLPFFAFFLITEDFIAARGRGGGLALWVRSEE
ncbi:hypothetical protein K9N68_33610 [Kovacikia minuta CCNUW1]|uniref:hypothetical protein n=1 Tax=Kovacikia minuta TaxID=2931930 RepID=UPI001CCFF7B6|nr:hypothetical protein [Kovacikia minuta]UBF26382.1 hypothetical protein K9N68_33610 [Kovacikia minuta CCNUW1]